MGLLTIKFIVAAATEVGKMKKVFAVLMIMLLAACGTKEEAKKEEQKTYVVGMSADFAPFEYREGSEIVGFDVDLAREIEKQAGIKLELQDIAFAGLLPALQTGKIDAILSGMSVTEERKKAVNFSKPYFNVSQVIVVKKDEDTINSGDDLSGKNVGVALGTTSDTLAEGIEGINLTKYNKTYEAILALNTSKIDAIILDYQQAVNFVGQNPELKILPKELAKEEYAIAVGKENTELLEKINGALDNIVGSEFYEGLLEKYIVEKK